MIWHSYFFYRFVRLTLFFTLLCYSFFIVADLVSHVKALFDPKTSNLVWITYYLALLSRRLDIFLPFSAAIAATSIMIKAIQEHVLIALRCSGLSLRTFLSPFFLGSLLFIALLGCNNEWIYPIAAVKNRTITETDFGREKEKESENRLGVIMLHNGERLFFNRHIAHKQLLEDTFWYISEDQICHIEQVFYSPKNKETLLYGIDYFIRDISGRFIKSDAKAIKQLPPLQMTQQQLRIATGVPKELSISDLITLSECYGSSKSEKATEVKVALYGKILTPLLPLFSIAIAALFSLNFERKKSTILPFAGSIGALFVIHVILQATNILARALFIPSTIALLIPWITLSYGITRKLKQILHQ